MGAGKGLDGKYTSADVDESFGECSSVLLEEGYECVCGGCQIYKSDDLP